MNDLLINNTNSLAISNSNTTNSANIKNISWKNPIQEDQNTLQKKYQFFLKSQEWGKNLRQQITTPLTPIKNKSRHKKRSTNILISEFTTEQIQALTTQQIQALTTQQIQVLTPEQIKSFTKEQIQTLKTQQIQTFTTEQFQSFSTEQKQNFKNKQIPAFTKEDLITEINKMDLQNQSSTFESKPNLLKI